MSNITRSEMREAMEEGRLWRISVELTVPGNNSAYVGFTTADDPVYLESRDISTTSEDAYVLLFENSSYTGGTVVVPQSRNRELRDRTDLSPVTDVKAEVAGVPAGLPVTGAHLLFSNKGTAFIGQDPDASVIKLRPNTQHVVQLWNNHASASIIAFGAMLRRES